VGALNRRIRIAAREGEARAVVEDDFHHFRVTIAHDGRRVTAAKAEALRRPWTTCSLAADRLTELVGFALSPCASAILDHTDALQQCTHMFDLAGLAIAAAARGQSLRSYEAVVPDRRGDRTRASLARDGEPYLAWDLEGTTIVGARPFGGRDMRAGFSDWVKSALSLEEVEAALVLRRAIFISGGRGVDLDQAKQAPAGGGCFARQPERAALGKRMVGSTLDFTERAEVLLRDDRAWLAFQQ
jgi:hypothetical protein